MKVTSAQFIKGIRGTDEILWNGIPQIAFVGRSNVGKSSVINALVNRKDLVRVGKKPGKTTEINFFLINGKFYLVDLPGYGYAELPPKEREKLRKLILWYLTTPEGTPALIVLILDAKVGLTDFDKQMIEVLRREGRRYVIIANKIDKLTQKEVASQLATIKRESGEAEIFLCSAETKMGVEELAEKLFANKEVGIKN